LIEKNTLAKIGRFGYLLAGMHDLIFTHVICPS